MRVLIISDTHGQDGAIMEICRREKRIDVLLHAGDSEGSEAFYREYMRCVTHFVAGNCDGFCRLPSWEVFPLGKHTAFLTHGHRYGVFGAQVPDALTAAARENGADIAVFGHSHIPLVEEKEGILCVNPGSLARPRQAGHRPSYAVMEIGDADQAINCRIRYL
ncbi:metallophosphoesterase [Lachnoclostridium sp. Marseille-P6806]|uniref:metallophosphoesterase n=1 Tax=Lachnoclostridium sp. Marseille-P6806 TaxID=2364793 RepID=UPI0010304D9E|nr:metallophosphoesterase [Lachnoclostridium sp. Marseille-P6806]